MIKKWVVVSLAVVALGAVSHASDKDKSDKSATNTNALLDALVEKGVLSHQEGEQIQAKLTEQESKSPAAKIGMADHITKLKLFGDTRLRFMNSCGMGIQNPSDTTTVVAINGQDNQSYATRNRFMYRLRIGADYTFTDKLSATIRLETSPQGGSGNVTMGDDNNTNSSGGWPWSKGNDGVFVGQVYLTWKPYEGSAISIGRQPPVLEKTSMIWDSDLNPEGASEQYIYKIGKFDLGLNLGQYLYATNVDRAFNGVSANSPWMLAEQIVAKYNFEKKSYAQVAPSIYHYVNSTGTFTGNTVLGNGSSESDGLLIFDTPMEVVIPAWDRPLKFFADVAINLDANSRARQAGDALRISTGQRNYGQYVASQGDEDTSFRVGMEYGQNKKKHDWKVGYFYQRTEEFAIDASMTDSDVFDRGVNMEGHSFYGSYNFTDFLTGGVSYMVADCLDKKLPTGNNSGTTVGTNTLGQYSYVQVDIIWKF